MKVVKLLLELLRGLYKMGVCLIKKSGGAPDTRGITAVESDVLKGKTFLKVDGNVGTGTMTDRGSPTYNLPINGSIVLPEGSYTGGTVKQNVPTFPGQTVYSGKNKVVVETSGKYATGNIYIPQIKGLTPAVIKKGMYVAGVGPGTWEGYVNDDPDTPFFYGTFGPEYGAVELLGRYVSQKGFFMIYKDSIEMSTYATAPAASETIAMVITKPINLSLYKTISIEAEYSEGIITSALVCYLARNFVQSWIYKINGGETTYNPDIGHIKSFFGLISPLKGICDVSGLSGNAYLYLELRGNMSRDFDATIFSIKCNR